MSLSGIPSYYYCRAGTCWEKVGSAAEYCSLHSKPVDIFNTTRLHLMSERESEQSRYEELTTRIDKLEQQSARILDELTEIKNMLLYAPGGQIAKEAEERFYACDHK